jgi:hypothetical protein
MHLRLTSILAILAACGPGSSMSETEPGSETAGPSTGDASADTGATTGAPTSGGPSSTGDTGDAVPCGAELPPAGSACASEGEACAPDADPCAPYTSAECRGGVWSYVEVGPGDPEQCAPDCDPFPVEGEACAAHIGWIVKAHTSMQLRHGAGNTSTRCQVPASHDRMLQNSH